MKDINQIKSKNFTQDIPPGAKFKLGEQVAIVGDIYSAEIPKYVHRDNKRFGRFFIGTVIGFQHNTKGVGSDDWYVNYRIGRRMNRYYILFHSGDICAVSSMYVV